MPEPDSIEEIFYKFLQEYQYEESDLDYSVLDKHVPALQTLSEIGNSGVHIFDICTRKVLYFSLNFGALLGYSPTDYEVSGQRFFENIIHPDDKLALSKNGVATFRIFNSLPVAEKMHYKLIQEYRMMDAQGKYKRLIEQYQILELDKKGQMWLLVGIVDLSPNQEDINGIKCQFINFKTGKSIPSEAPEKTSYELTKRELEILKLVKDGYLSKEISNRLSISLHTVNTHRQRFLEKLGANNSFEAVTFASRYGLLG